MERERGGGDRERGKTHISFIVSAFCRRYRWHMIFVPIIEMPPRANAFRMPIINHGHGADVQL